MIRLGIGDVTQPLVPSIIKALHSAVDEMAVQETFRGYAPDLGYEFLRSVMAREDYKARGCDISADEVFMNIGTLGSYMQNMKKQAAWDLKKSSGDFTSKKKSLEEWLNSTKRDENGLTLKEKEEAADKKNTPEVYAKAKSIEQERESYKEEMKRCRTKEDVQKLKMSRLSTSMATVNEVIHNPVIPLEKKLQYVMMENAKTEAVKEETQKFVESGEYGKLLTEAEYNKAMKEIEEAREEEKKVDSETKEKAEPKTEQADETKEEEVKEADSGKREVVRPGPRRKTEDMLEAESEQVRRAKKAKAKAAYRQHLVVKSESDALAEEVIAFSKNA